jgi:transposase InsO family protein
MEGWWAALAAHCTPSSDLAHGLYVLATLLAAGALHRLLLLWRRSGLQRARFAQFARRSYGLPDLAGMPRGAAAACAEMWVAFDALRARGVCKAAPVVTMPLAEGETPRRNRSYAALAALDEHEPLDALAVDETLLAVGRGVGLRPQLPVTAVPRRAFVCTEEGGSPGRRAWGDGR